MEQREETPAAARLERGLGALDATTIVVGTMIGSGIFITSAESMRLVGSPGWLLAAWALAGLLTVTGALCCAELAAMMPRAGGQYVFLREAYGPALGFLFGWSLLLVIQTGTVAAVAVAFARFTGVLVPWVASDNYVVRPFRLTEGYALSLSTEQLLAVLLILLLTFTNTLGLKLGKLIQNAFTFTKTAALVGLIVVGLGLGWNQESAAYTSDWWNPWANGWTPQAAQTGIEAAGPLALLMFLGRAMAGPLFAQSAWNNVTFTGSEVRDPARNLPRALLVGCAVVVGLYLLANLAYVVTLPLGVMQKPGNSIATATMSQALGPAGVTLMAAAVMVSTFGCNNGLILAGARVTYAMARDGLFFRPVARLNSRRVPAFALAVQGVWAAFLTLPRTVTATVNLETGAVSHTYGNVYTQLLEYIIPADLVFYVLMVGAVFILRRKAPDAPRPFRTPGYPLVPLVYVLLATLLTLDLAYLVPDTSGPAYLLVLSGLPVYFAWRRSVNAVPDKSRYEQKGSGKRLVTAESKRRYVVTALFVCVFIVSTTILLGNVSGIFTLISDTTTWIALIVSIISAVGTASTQILSWRKDRRDAREQNLKIALLEQDLKESREKLPPSKPEGSKGEHK